jgi:ribose 5-phosphate isomerase
MSRVARTRKAPDRREHDAEKRAEARQAAGLVGPGMVVSLGSGTTADLALRYLAARLDSELPGLGGIPTSEKTGAEARRLGIPPSLDDHPVIDPTIDGADEVVPDWNLPARAVVAEAGLFCGLATGVIIAAPRVVEQRERQS